MVQKIRSYAFIVIGIVALFLSFKCYTMDDLKFETRSMYGGDAFTGIQNAAAVTSENVKDLAAIVQFGFGSVLLVMGLAFVGIGLTSPIGSLTEKNNSNPDYAEYTPEAEAPKEIPAKEDNNEA